MDGEVTQLATLLREARSVVALTGAGISVPSGIPDFRSPGTGLWENVDPMEVAHIDAWRRDPERFWRFYGSRFDTLSDKQPNGAHAALAELEARGVLEDAAAAHLRQEMLEPAIRRQEMAVRFIERLALQVNAAGPYSRG